MKSADPKHDSNVKVALEEGQCLLKERQELIQRINQKS